jgi:hypothetical protein
LVTRLRKHQTKAGKDMAFVTLEDIQGNIELVIFPRTWEQVQKTLDYERIVVVDGRVDAEGAEPKVLVDSVTTELTTYASSDQSNKPLLPRPAATQPQASPELAPARPAQSIAQPGGRTQTSQPQPPAVPNLSPSRPSRQVAEPPPNFESDPDNQLSSPVDGSSWTPTELVPDGFVVESEPLPVTTAVAEPLPPDELPELPGIISSSLSSAAVSTTELPLAAAALPSAATLQPVFPKAVLPNEKGLLEPSASIEPPAAPATQSPVLPKTTPLPVTESVPLAVSDVEASELRPVPYILSAEPIPDVDQVRMLSVILRQSGDKVRDNIRMRHAYGILISYPGVDRFAFVVYERGRGYQIEFPNFTTGINPELISRLHKLVGSENVHVETIKFH